MTIERSIRTVIRDAIVSTLEARAGAADLRNKDFDVALTYLSPEECKRFPTYCVIVTDETPGELTLQDRQYTATIVIVIYVQHDRDPRAMLDASIEDVYETMLIARKALQPVARHLSLDSLTTDENPTSSSAHPQAVQRWSALTSRAVTA